MSHELRHECGLFGIYGGSRAVETTYWGLRALQHRGQESAGIATPQMVHVGMGLVHEVFSPSELAALDDSGTAIGHVRYSTSGQSKLRNAQPLVVNTRFGRLAVAMNGNLVNYRELRAVMGKEHGSVFSTSTDAELLFHLLTQVGKETNDFQYALQKALALLQGAYCFLILHNEDLYAVRDPHGFRPLCVGERNGATVIASESVALDHPEVAASYSREIGAGEIFRCRDSGQTSSRLLPEQTLRQCVFEHVYFARPDGRVFGRPVALSRERLGARLAREDNPPPPPGAIVVGVPDSGIPAAYGYGKASGLIVVPAITREHYLGRAFLDPDANGRERLVELKLRPIRYLLEGKTVVLVDDSIVRGHTSRKIVRMVRAAGATAVHLRITSPPIISPCFYGIDTPTREELIAISKGVEAVREFVGADSLRHLSLAGMHEACGQAPDGPILNCDACFTGNYPTDLFHINARLQSPPKKS